MSSKSTAPANELCELILTQAFPFHFVINDNGNIVSCGTALNRLLAIDTDGGESLQDHFTLQHPSNVTTVDELEKYQNTFFLIKSCVNP